MLTVAETANIVEGILFLSPRPVRVEDVVEHIKAPMPIVLEAIALIEKRYSESGLELRQAGGGYEIVTRKEYSEHLRVFFGEMDKTKLSRAALETLAIIAYKQPVTRADIEAVRGVNSSGSIKSLMEKGLVRISEKGDTAGRPFLFSTTQDFLIFLGINNLDDLPPIDSFDKKV